MFPAASMGVLLAALLIVTACTGSTEISESARQLAQSHYESAIELGNEGRFDAALIELDQAVVLNPNSASI